MYFLLNDVVLDLQLERTPQAQEPRRISSLGLEDLKRLGREIFAEEPRLQHRSAERALRLVSLIVSKAPAVNAALFVVPMRGCSPGLVAARFSEVDPHILADLHRQQKKGMMSAALAEQAVWGRVAA